MTDDGERGSRAGEKLPAEKREYADPSSGARVTQLTDFRGVDDYHLEFRTDGWYDGGDRLLIPLQRPRRMNLFSVDRSSGELTQLTDLPGVIGSVTSVHETRNEAYFGYRHETEPEDGGLFAVYAVDVDDCTVRRAFTPPERFESYVLHVGGTTADGSRLLIRFQEPFAPDNVDERTRHQVFPHCVVGTVPVDGDGEFEVVHEEDYRISHVDPSPTDPERALFCHEGPASEVDHRMWHLDLESKRVRKLGRADAGERIDREHWLRDGAGVGYLGRRPGGEVPVFGVASDETVTETRLPDAATHVHAHTRDRFLCEVDEGSERRILVYESDEDGEGYRGPRELTTRRWDPGPTVPESRPHFGPDGSTVLFSSESENGTSNVFLVEVPDDVDALPRY